MTGLPLQEERVCSCGRAATLKRCTKPQPRGRVDPALASVTGPDWPTPLATQGFENGQQAQ
jgi:hypothetical protein